VSDEIEVREPDQLAGVPLPESRSQVIGHEAARATIRAALDASRLPGGMLLHGPRGIGKATLAFDIAREVFAKTSDESPAHIAAQVAAGGYPNLRVLRKAARDTGKYKEIVQHEYTNEMHDRIDQMVLDEPKHIRGANVRYWEEVQEGEELPTIARGPLSLMDTMGFLVGCGRGHTHGVVLQAAVKHPGHFFRNPEAGGGVEYTGIGHHRESVAKEVGVPGTYDYGPQRSSWMCTLVTNWMGDACVIKRVRTEMRRFNIVGDTTFCKARVVRKYVKDKTALVDIEIAAENQRGEVTTPGIATVALPSRDVKLPAFIDGANCDLELPVVR